jgi:predicted ATP-grasp superfamily ATP-dependent carboligase
MREDGGRTLKRILVAGFSTRHVVMSAWRAGYEVCAVDHFCDADLRNHTLACMRFEELSDLPVRIREMCESYSIDAIIPTSGAETLRDLPAPVLGTDPGIAARFLDKGFIQDWFYGLNIPVPPRAEPGEFPAMLKPLSGSGGWRNTVVSTPEDITSWMEAFPGEPFLLQRIVQGIPASVCCVAGEGRARAIAVNRQILRGDGPYRFGFAGSQTPFYHPMQDVMISCAERAAAASGCRGILGIDFMVSDDAVYAIELNPRFVATLDTIEAATGVNLVGLHIDACRGILPDAMPVPVQYALRRILFADRPCEITDDLSFLAPQVADIPVSPAMFDEGSAVISVYGSGRDLAAAQEALDTTIRVVRQYIR